MFEKLFKYLVLGLLVIIIIINFFKAPEGISPEEEIYRLKIHDLNQELTAIKNEVKIIELDNERIKKGITSDSSAIYNNSRAYRDSLRATLFR